MNRRTDTRLERLKKRADNLTARRNPSPLVILVQPPDAEHPHGTRVRSAGGGVTIYYDPAAGKPGIPERGPHTIVVVMEPDDPNPPPDMEEVLRELELEEAADTLPPEV